MEIIWGRFVEKTGGKKSRATVPLSLISFADKTYKYYDVFPNVNR